TKTSRQHRYRLRNNDHVSWFQKHVLTEVFSLDDLGIVEPVKDTAFTAPADDNSFGFVCKFKETACQRYSLQYTERFIGCNHSRLADFSCHVDFVAQNSVDNHRYIGHIEIFSQATFNLRFELLRVQSCSLHILDERKGNPAIRPNRNLH